VVLAAWLGFFGLGWYGPWVAYLAEIAPADKVGLTLGAAMALNQLGIIAAPPLLASWTISPAATPPSGPASSRRLGWLM
jgi:MFS family permease